MSTSSVNTAKRLLLRGGVVLLLAAVATLVASRSATATTLPTGFVETTEFTGLNNPTVITFAPNGRVFVAEKSGLIKSYDDLDDNTPTQVANLSNEVYNFWDRGLLGLAVDPQWPADPYLYALYTRDALPGGEPQEWGSPGVLSDPCPSPPGPTGDGCVVSARLSRLTITGGVMSAQTPLITDWCQQYPSHSIGDLAFGPEGALYVSGGDGAAWHITDYGQDGDPVNPCGDPPGPPGTALTPPTAEGGALRSQDVRTSSDPTGLNGSILRLNPDTGAAMPDNPNAGSSDPNARRIVAYGFRNPFRFTIRPGTDEVWIGEVGRGTWEEINRVVDPNDATADNFGWPCYEGVPAQGGFNGANLDLCEDLYDQGTGAVVPPYFAYHHDSSVVDETCPFGSSSLAGIDFYESGPFPGNYDGALFFADYSRDCVWVMRPGPGGVPDPSQVEPFAEGAANPVDIEVGPGGDLFYADFDGTIKRVTYTGPNTPPTAVATATPSSGAAPLEVELDASGSTDPDGDTPLTFAWDLDEDGQFDDSSAVTLEHTFNDPGTYEPAVRVTDPGGASGTDTVSVQAGNSPPVAQIDSPTAADDWAVDEVIAFSGSATDDQETLPGSAFDWDIIIDHCPSNCHQHDVQEFDGVTQAQFAAPDHDYPSALILELTVTDSGGLSDTASVRVDPRTANLTLASNPAGVGLALGDAPTPAPFTRTVIEGSRNTVIAPPEEVVGGEALEFVSWSDGGALTHDVTVDHDQTLTASYLDVTPKDSSSPQTTIVRGPRDGLVVPLRTHAGKSRRFVKLKFSFAASEPASFQCRLDVAKPRGNSREGGWYESKGAHCVVKKRKPGLYTLRVRAIDLAGNVDPTPAARHFRIVRPDQG